ncbi:MAG TPA: VCBS repeat-containing protein, partial [Polyangiaceae bacterium LLY-WYZ-15_(1-7)]|nr:VCBS repeat-containing protein [Polyangiaceae bacterium LLY-WYZ-15_(1-7)]
MKRDARLAWAVLLVLGLAALFWGWSRGPALNEKATMAGEVSLDAIGFDQVVAVHEDDPFLRKVGAVAVNWAATNRVGMTFGVLFGAALMTLLALIDLRRLRGRSLGAGVGAGLVGMASGAPLGVCVNCAAPIAQGLAAGGSRLETTLAAMMASPTLNVVALLLLFTLFPFHVAAVKLGLTLVLLLAVLPALARTVLAGERDRSLTHALPSREAGPQPPAWSGGGALDGARWVAHAFLKNGWFVAKTTVPLMLAAGLFGALVVVLLPLDRLPEIVAATSLSEALLWSLALALLGAALPVPITFDVIVCAVLYAAGLPLRFVAVLLFTLGVYSVYSGLVIGRGISKRTALVLFAAVAALGVVAGDVTQAWANAARSSTLAALDTLEGEEPGWAVAPPETRPVELPRPAWEPVAPGVERRAVASLPRAEVDEGFTALDAAALGLETPATLTPLHIEYPFVQGRGRTLAAGDVHGDGLDDLVVVSEAGVVLHENAGGTFGARPLDLPGVPLFAALVDLDADGALDLYVGGLRGDRWLPGDGEGGFGEARELLVDGRWVAAAGFADLDADGDLDAITSRWSPAWRGPWKTAEASSDVLLRNDGAGRFTPEPLPSLPGAGTAVLL